MAWKNLLAAALVLILGILAVPAIAQPSNPDKPFKPSATDVATTRQLSPLAFKAYKEGDYAKALDLFTRINTLIGRLPTTDLYRARCLAQLNRLVEASEVYLAVARTKLADDANEKYKKAKEDAARERQELMPRIPKVTYQISRPVPKGAALTVDGKTVAPALHGIPQPIDPGRHKVEVTGPGQGFNTGFEISEGQSKKLIVRVADPPPEPPPPTATATSTTTTTETPPPPDDTGSVQRTFGWVAIGVGAAGLLVGAITGGLAMSKKGALDDNCPGGNCRPDYHGDIDSFEAMRMASTVTFIIGGVAAATGIILVLTAPSGSSEEPGADESATSSGFRLRAVLGPTGAALQGQF